MSDPTNGTRLRQQAGRAHRSGVEPRPPIGKVAPEKVALAALLGDTDQLQAYLDQGEDIHAHNDLALQSAAQNGVRQTVQWLLDHGADVNAEGGMPLANAAQSDKREMVRLLLARGALVDAGRGRALQAAAFAGNAEIVEMLLRHGADACADNNAAIRIAAKNGRANVVRLLLCARADPLHAGPARDFETLDTLLASFDVPPSAQGGGGSTQPVPQFSAREFAAQKGHGQVLAMIDAHLARQQLAEQRFARELPNTTDAPEGGVSYLRAAPRG